MVRMTHQSNGNYLAEINQNVSFTVTDKTVNIIQNKSYDKHFSNVTLTKGDVLKMAEIIKEQNGNKGSFRTPQNNRIDYNFSDGFKGDKRLLPKHLEMSGASFDMMIDKIDSTLNFPIIESDNIHCVAEYYYDEENDESYLDLHIYNK